MNFDGSLLQRKLFNMHPNWKCIHTFYPRDLIKKILAVSAKDLIMPLLWLLLKNFKFFKSENTHKTGVNVRLNDGSMQCMHGGNIAYTRRHASMDSSMDICMVKHEWAPTMDSLIEVTTQWSKFRTDQIHNYMSYKFGSGEL